MSALHMGDVMAQGAHGEHMGALHMGAWHRVAHEGEAVRCWRVPGVPEAHGTGVHEGST